MIKVIRQFFSTKQHKGLNLIKKFSEEFYMDNFDKCIVQEGFPQASISTEIDQTLVKLFGVPITVEESEQTYDNNLDELERIMLSECEEGSSFMIQLDPSPYLYKRRQLGLQFFKKSQSLYEDDFLKETPMMPLDHTELQLDLHLFDLVYLIQQRKSQQVSEEQHQKSLKEILFNPALGYFSKFYSGEDDQSIDQDQLDNNLHEIGMSTIMYEHQIKIQEQRSSTPFMMSALFYGLLTGPTYLGDISKIFMRTYQGQVVPLEELKLLFKEMYTLKMNSPDGQSYLPFEAAQLAWRQFLKDYYLLFTINKIVTEKPKSLNVFVENIHFEPLRLSLLAQEGNLISEIDMGYSQNFKFPKLESNQNDEQMIEKHAMLDFIENLPIWKEPMIHNPFPYLSQDYLSLQPNEQKEIQKTFFKYNSLYKRIVGNVQKMKNN